MSDIDSQSVKNCWSKIQAAKGSHFFVENFYRFMFEHHPETRPLFPNSLVQQKTTLLSTLDNVINGIEYIEELEKELIDLGRHHKNLGIKKEMFDAFVKTVVAAANYSSDYSLTDKELAAWEAAFRKISNIMLKAY